MPVASTAQAPSWDPPLSSAKFPTAVTPPRRGQSLCPASFRARNRSMVAQNLNLPHNTSHTINVTNFTGEIPQLKFSMEFGKMRALRPKSISSASYRHGLWRTWKFSYVDILDFSCFPVLSLSCGHWRATFNEQTRDVHQLCGRIGVIDSLWDIHAVLTTLNVMRSNF